LASFWLISTKKAGSPSFSFAGVPIASYIWFEKFRSLLE